MTKIDYRELDKLAEMIHNDNRAKGFWDTERNVGELLMLIVTELSEAQEAHRKDLMDDHLMDADGKPKYSGLWVELGDALIRILDACGGLGIPIGDVVAEKLYYNKTRPHLHGKKY